MSGVKKFDACAALGEKQRMFDPNVEERFEFLVSDKLKILAPAQFSYVQRVFPHWIADLKKAGLLVLEWTLPEPKAYLTESRYFKPRGVYGAQREVSFSVRLAIHGAVRDLGMKDEDMFTGVVSLVRKKFALSVLEKYPLPFDPLNTPFEAGWGVSISGLLLPSLIKELESGRFREFLEKEGAEPLSFETHEVSGPPNWFRVTFTWPHPYSWESLFAVRQHAGDWLRLKKPNLAEPIGEFHPNFESPRKS